MRPNSVAPDAFAEVKWQTTLNCEIKKSPDIPRALLSGYDSMAWSTASVLGLSEIVNVLATRTKLL